MTDLLIYTHQITSRNRYTFRLYFAELLGLHYKITDNEQEFRAYQGPRLSYTQQQLSDELFFNSRSLLFEAGITEQNITVFEWENRKVFYAVGKSSALPFDLFAAGFYLVSRYEEYLPHIRDKLDRFDAHQSLAWQNGFLREPVINQWALLLATILCEKFPQLNCSLKSYTYVATIDIDNAWAYKEKGIVRTLGAIGRDLFKLDFTEFKNRIRVLTGLQKDPYDTYDFQLQLHKRYGINPIYFFLVGDYGINDKNIPVQNRRFRQLIRHIADYSQVGVHPSFGSNKFPEKLKVEISRLRSILHYDITRSRQHFLMLKFPDTYRNLWERDIRDDYSMGFANEVGFRAGICTPFNFYDLDLESEATLRIHPFAVMDATLNLYMKLKPEEAIIQVKELINKVREVKGVFMTLWHNETLSDEKQWQGWREVYEEILVFSQDEHQYKIVKKTIE